MSQTPNSGKDEDRLRPPFPSRRELHGSRIPKRPQNAPVPHGIEEETPKYSDDGPIRRRPPVTPQPVEPTQATVEPVEAIPTSPKASEPARGPQSQEIRLSWSELSSRNVPTEATPLAQKPGTSEPATSGSSEGEIEDTHIVDAAVDPTEDTAVEPTQEPTVEPDTEMAVEPVVTLPAKPAAEPEPSTTGIRSRRLEQERLAYKARKRRKKSWITVIVLLVVLALIATGAWFAISAIKGTPFSFGSLSAPEDYPGPGEGEVTVTVEPGDLGTQIAKTLVDADVIKSAGAFVRAFEANPAASSIKPGTYTLKKHMVAADALAALLDETNRSENTVTVIPGQTVSQVEEKLEAMADFSKEDIEAALADPEALGLPSEANGNLEGWLWAGSYEVSSTDTPATVLTQMVSRTVDFLKSQGIAPDQWETILIKASILEREVASNDYMGKVARVIENRLGNPEGETRGMLQMDSTVLYGVGKYGGVPTQADMEDDNPYNTYRHAGLPPTPIATPGEAAIIATLNPEDGDWLYFVTVNLDTGETLFTNSAQEQTTNTEKLIQWCSDNPGKC